jgi:uncharacterized caspase-like protein
VTTACLPAEPDLAPNPLRLLLALLALALGLLGAAPADAAESARRYALVIGNNAYPTAPLLNPVNDARAMAQVLQERGFTVITRLDADQRSLTSALREFGEKLKEGGPGTAGLFYFAGHGMQIKGRNYLVPVGANIEHEDEVAYQALDAQAVMDKMESAGNGTNIVILDACRNNPFARSFRSARQGLAQMDAPVGTIVAFSTAPGSVASDGTGSNGLYTSHLLAALKRPGQKVEDVFKQVRMAVLRDSGNKQVPWEASSLVGDFYFNAPTSDAPVTAATALPPAAGSALDPQAALDDALWNAVKDSTASAEIFAYLNRFPSGRHARTARTRLLELSGPGTAPAPSQPAAAPTPGPQAATTSRPLSDSEVENVLRANAEGERQRLENISIAQRRINEIVKWGETGTNTRPANPRRSSGGFTEGDRYRWRVLDQQTDRYTIDYFWRIDRIEPDGSLWINDGAQRMDGLGQLRGGSDDVTGHWLDWSPALPLAAALAQPEHSQMPLQTVLQWRDADGVTTRAQLSGQLHGPVVETVMTASELGMLPTRRLEAYLRGPAVTSKGRRFELNLQLNWYFAKDVGLPVRLVVEERHDDRLVRRTRHDLTAVDVFSLPATVEREPR